MMHDNDVFGRDGSATHKQNRHIWLVLTLAAAAQAPTGRAPARRVGGCAALTLPPIHCIHCLTCGPQDTAPRAKPFGGMLMRSAQCQGAMPWIAGSVFAHSQYPCAARTPRHPSAR